MKKIITVILCLLLIVPVFADYGSLTLNEMKKVIYAFDKAKVYNDLISGEYTVKIISREIIRKEPIDKETSVYLVRVVFDKIPKSTPADVIRTQIDIPVKVTISRESVSVWRYIFYGVALTAAGFFGGRLSK